MEWQEINMVKSFITLAHGGKLKYCSNLLWYAGTAVNYFSIFTTLAHMGSESYLLSLLAETCS
jgi:hypothetical protein